MLRIYLLCLTMKHTQLLNIVLVDCFLFVCNLFTIASDFIASLLPKSADTSNFRSEDTHCIIGETLSIKKLSDAEEAIEYKIETAA